MSVPVPVPVPEHRRLVVVGSGPAGYTAAIYAARADLHPLVLEGAQFGGALMNTTEVDNFPGFRGGIQGPDLMAEMRAQAQRFGAEIVTDDAVEVELAGPVKSVATCDRRWSADAVVLAMGSAHRKLGLPREDELSGHGVSWCATCDGFFFRDRDIYVVGGGDTALEEATFLTRFARSVTVVHRRDELRASRIMVQRAQTDPKIRWELNAQVTALHGDGTLTELVLTSTCDGRSRAVAADGLFIAIGHDPRSELVAGQVDLDAAGYVRTVGGSTRTDVRGVFAAGDVGDHSYRQAVTAAGSGCQAALDAERFLAEATAAGTDGHLVHGVA
ncbi:MAG: thioredoxin-disulfide reductase [Pseudonocardia sp.]